MTRSQVTVADSLAGPRVYDLLKPAHLCIAATLDGSDPPTSTGPSSLACYQAKLARTSPAQPRFLSGPSQRLIGVFVLFILLPGAFLGGFACRVLRQEGQLARQRTRESLERTADEIGRYLDSEFRRWSDAVRSAAEEGMFNADSFPEIIRQAFP